MGVLHDGNKIFKFTNNTLNKLKKKLILISNTSQTVAEFKLRTLKKIKLKFIYFDKIITAGEALINIVRKSKNDPISKIVSSKQSYIISNGNEKQIINKLKIINTDYTQCRFILAMSLKPKKNLFNILSKIKKLAKRKIPMVCTDPDIYTFKKRKDTIKLDILLRNINL